MEERRGGRWSGFKAGTETALKYASRATTGILFDENSAGLRTLHSQSRHTQGTETDLRCLTPSITKVILVSDLVF